MEQNRPIRWSRQANWQSSGFLSTVVTARWSGEVDVDALALDCHQHFATPAMQRRRSDWVNTLKSMYRSDLIPLSLLPILETSIYYSGLLMPFNSRSGGNRASIEGQKWLRVNCLNSPHPSSTKISSSNSKLEVISIRIETYLSAETAREQSDCTKIAHISFQQYIQ